MTNELNDEKNFLKISTIGAIIGFIIPLVMWALKKDDFSDYAKDFLKKTLNFELFLFIIGFLFCWIPLLGWLFGMFLFITNLIISLNAFSAVQDNREYDYPVRLQLVK